MTNPTITVDREAGAIYIRISEKRVGETISLSDSAFLDVSEDGKVVGLEILGADSNLFDRVGEETGAVPLTHLISPTVP